MLSSVMAEEAEGAEASADDQITWLKIGCLSLAPVTFDERVKDGNSRPVPEEMIPTIRVPYCNDTRKKGLVEDQNV